MWASVDLDMNSRSIQVMLLKQTIDSLVNLDHGLADAVYQGDDDVDDLLSSMYRLTEYRINTDPDNLSIWIPFLTISRYLERIADHAMNVAEDVNYMINGEGCRHRT